MNSPGTNKRRPSPGKRKSKANKTIKTFFINIAKRKQHSLAFKKYLINYVVNHEVNKEVESAIEIKCKMQTPRTIVLYRGHDKTDEIRKNSWYSATKSKKVAKEEFAGETGCVFKINVINVPIIDINQFVKNEIGKYAKEEECIILGGGTFYKNVSLTEIGFKKLENGEFECWYTLNNNNYKKSRSLEESSIIDRAFAQIPEDEYEYILAPSDIIVDGLVINDSQRNFIYDKIIKRKIA